MEKEYTGAHGFPRTGMEVTQLLVARKTKERWCQSRVMAYPVLSHGDLKGSSTGLGI